MDRLPGWVILIVLLAGSASAASAQTEARPLIDGLTLAPGISAYLGDLDGNPGKDPIHYFANGRAGLMVAADRRFGRASGSVALHFDQLRIDRGEFELSNRLFSLDLVGGYHFDIFREDLLRLFAGVGTTFLNPSYERMLDVEEVRELGSRAIITFPVGMVLQERIHVGMRFTSTDYLDGFSGSGGNRDLIFFLKVGYRFSFVR